MKTRCWTLEDGGWSARSVLERGGPVPLSEAAHHCQGFQNASGRRAGAVLWGAVKAEGPAQSQTWRTVGAMLAFLGIALSVSAQSYSIDWYKISGGGGTSSNGQYTVNGTIGQPDAGGAMSGGNYSLTGGFWALISVVQTPGAPTLYISHVGNTVTVYWQDTSGWTLQQNNNLTVPAGWSASSGVTTANGTNYLTITPPTGNLFFRLSNP